MTINYQLTEDDYVNYLMHYAAGQHRIQRMRLVTKLLLSIFVVLFGALAWIKGDMVMGISFTIVFPVVLFLLPKGIERWIRRRIYKYLVKGPYKSKTNVPISATISNDLIVIKTPVDEVRKNTTEIKAINELPTLILLKLPSGESVVLSKTNVANLQEVKARLKELSIRWGVPYNVEGN